MTQSTYRDIQWFGQGVDASGDAIGFDLVYTGNNNRSLVFENCWMEDFSLYGYKMADTIGLTFLGATRIRNCGSRTNSKGAGIYLYNGGRLSDNTAALVFEVEAGANVSACYPVDALELVGRSLLVAAHGLHRPLRLVHHVDGGLYVFLDVLQPIGVAAGDLRHQVSRQRLTTPNGCCD